ncbi:Type 1 glutamine amidotransferase-like domain-containing protein [Polaromonas sp.]|nr:Type 1 glutamine amidotransferase-like domain-containing protein [Candidatus Saccharibacteria bacterium]
MYLSSYRLGNKPDELLKLLGSKKRTALIVNAIDSLEPQERKIRLLEEVERLKSIGLEPVEIDLRNYFGKTDELKAELLQFDLIWVRGGNVFILRRAFKQSGADTFFAKMLQTEQVVYGGYSAGICILQPHLRGIELVDQPDVIPNGYQAEVLWDCLGLLPYCVAPHYKSDHPESADIDKTVDYFVDNHIPFIALKDGQAILIDGSKQVVLN